MTDGGLETDLIFHHGADLPEFASFPLIEQTQGRELLAQYYDGYADVAQRAGVGPDARGTHVAGQPRLGRAARLRRCRARPGQPGLDLLPPRAPRRTSGAARPGRPGRGHARAARRRLRGRRPAHRRGVRRLPPAPARVVPGRRRRPRHRAHAGRRGRGDRHRGGGPRRGAADRCRRSRWRPTVGWPGAPLWQRPSRRPTRLAARTGSWSTARTRRHVARGLEGDGPWERIAGLRPNASQMSHAELDEAEELDEGDPAELQASLVAMVSRLPGLRILGGCCGTDARHVAAMWGV